MRGSAWTVARKELARFFAHKTSAFVAIVLPGFLIFLMWTVMGSAMSGMGAGEEEPVVKVAVIGLTDEIAQRAAEAGIEVVQEDSVPDIEAVRERIAAGEVGAVAVLTEGFDEAVATYDPASGLKAPQVSVYYDSTDTASSKAYAAFTGMLADYESSLSNRFDVNAGDEVYDVANERDLAASLVVSVVPMLLLILLFSGCMSVAAESVAGEKERGTMATLLATPVRRSDIALGKVVALALIGLAIAASSLVGILAGLPAIMQGQLDINVYGPTEYALLILVVLSTTLVMVVLIAMVSALAKTTKEAQLYLTPVMIAVMAVGLLGMFGDAQESVAYYLIPLYNSVQCMIGIFTFDFQPLNVAVCVAANLAYTGVGVAVLQRMFESERLMFAR